MKSLVDFINESNVNEQYASTFEINGTEMKIPTKPAKLQGTAGCVYNKKLKKAFQVWIDKNDFLVVTPVGGKDEIVGYVTMDDGVITTFDDRVKSLKLEEVLDDAFKQAVALYDGTEENDMGWPVPCYWDEKTYEK